MSEVHGPEKKRPRWFRWVVISSIVFTALAAVAILILIRFWPFTLPRLTESLQQGFPGAVKISRFHTVYFPRPGCVAEEITFTPPDHSASASLFFTVRKFTLTSNYPDLFFRPGYIARISLEGLHVVFPSGYEKSSSTSAEPGAMSSSKKETRVGELIADGAIVDFTRRDAEPPLRFLVHQLTLGSVSSGHSMEYRLAMTNPEPPGEVRSTGRFGPWKSRDPGQTPLSGSFTFQNADLGFFHGIEGTLSSQGRFGGILQRIDLQGSTDVPDFAVKRAKHPVHLTTQFRLLVNGINGDTELQRVDASFLRTKVVTVGTVSGAHGKEGKTASLDMSVREGRIQDLLRLFTHEKSPAMTAPLTLRTRVILPPGPARFLRKVMLDGDFAILGGHFTNPDRQASVDRLSLRARGVKSGPPPESVASNLNGHVVLRNGTANLTDLSYNIPSAAAILAGTYNLLNQKVDLHGHLKLEAKLSATSKGVKSFFLKVVDPVFKKKPYGSEIPVAITGTFDDPHFGLTSSPTSLRQNKQKANLPQCSANAIASRSLPVGFCCVPNTRLNMPHF